MGIRGILDWALRGRQQTCEACQGRFTCGPLKSCWCGKECLTRETLKQLKEKYHRCLCPACLRAAEDAVRAAQAAANTDLKQTGRASASR